MHLPNSEPRSPDRSRSTWRRLFGVPWWLVLAFWVVFGIVAGNQIVLSMPTHEHSWWRMVLWQVAAASGWVALTPAVLWLGMRHPLQPRLLPIVGHLGGALAVAALEAIPTTLFAMPIDPYEPVAAAQPFLAEYRFQLDNWLLLDVLLYFGIVALGTGIEAKRRLLREARLRADLAQAELRALRLELQPHFIFNALNAVVGLVRQGSAAEAEDMLIRLSELLRRTQEATGRQLVTVAEEVRLAELYLEIEQVRFGDRLVVATEVEDAVRGLMVPNLVLQPVVENAVKHGLARSTGAGTIRVHAHRWEDRLRLEVRNTAPEPRSTDPGDTAVGNDSAQEGYGLANVTSRLEAIYGGDWSFDLSRDGAETIAGLELPVAPPATSTLDSLPGSKMATAREAAAAPPVVTVVEAG